MKLSPLWTSYLALKLPCPPSAYRFSREHVLPKSMFPKIVAEDPRNIIPLPVSLNQARGALPYTAEWKGGQIHYACSKCPYPGYCRGAMFTSDEGAHPPDLFKGPIARSVLYSIGQYPSLVEAIDNNVLDLDTAIKWDSQFPMSEAESEWLLSL